MGMGRVRLLMGFKFFLNFHDFAALGLVFAFNDVVGRLGVFSFFSREFEICSHCKKLL
jgi:hypothetical protein